MKLYDGISWLERERELAGKTDEREREKEKQQVLTLDENGGNTGRGLG